MLKQRCVRENDKRNLSKIFIVAKSKIAHCQMSLVFRGQFLNSLNPWASIEQRLCSKSSKNIFIVHRLCGLVTDDVMATLDWPHSDSDMSFVNIIIKADKQEEKHPDSLDAMINKFKS